MSVEQLRPEENLIATKLIQSIQVVVDETLEAHGGQVTYLEVVGALEIIKSQYAVEVLAINAGLE